VRGDVESPLVIRSSLSATRPSKSDIEVRSSLSEGVGHAFFIRRDLRTRRAQ
jgi:hypothetical protein